MKSIRVAAAAICDSLESPTKIFATQKGYGEFKGKWEFPGGKLEAGETSEEALRRELMEELDTEVIIGDLVDTVEYDYPKFHLTMDCYFCQVKSGNLVLKEAQAAEWLSGETLDSVDWLPAAVLLLDKIRERLK